MIPQFLSSCLLYIILKIMTYLTIICTVFIYVEVGNNVNCKHFLKKKPLKIFRVQENEATDQLRTS
jgi:hypothetical protein